MLSGSYRHPRVLLCLPVLFLMVALVSGDFATFKLFGQHALCMQDWKKAISARLVQLASGSDSALDGAKGLNDTLQAAKGELETMVSAVKTTLDGLLSTLNTATASSGSSDFVTPLSAFQVRISSSNTMSSDDPNEPIKYTDESLDENNDHDTSTGLFTTPTLGLYWFIVTLTGSGRNELNIRVMRQATGLYENIAYVKYYGSQESSATAMAVLYPGDTVGVYPLSSSTSPFNMETGWANSFSGYMMAEYDDPDYTPPTTQAPPPATTTTTTTPTPAPTTTTTTTATPP
ncbi:hypothetical protein ACOMHN_003393 [Nucella lapillus]